MLEGGDAAAGELWLWRSPGFITPLSFLFLLSSFPKSPPVTSQGARDTSLGPGTTVICLFEEKTLVSYMQRERRGREERWVGSIAGGLDSLLVMLRCREKEKSSQL